MSRVSIKGGDSAQIVKQNLLAEALQGRVVGGTLSQLANYSDLFLRMSEGVFLVDQSGYRVLECNPAAVALLGVSEDQILGKSVLEIFGRETEIREAHQRSKSVEIQISSPRHGAQFLEIAATSLKILDYIEVVQVIARDVTEVKRSQNELHEMNQILHQLSTTDEMTGLKNFRYFKEALAAVHQQAEAFRLNYGIIFVDVDHFKLFNDRNGHPEGDRVLQRVAQILRQSVRSDDLPARYGGEEFVVLCRGVDLQLLTQSAEKIRQEIERESFRFGEHQPLGKVTVSIGVAGYPDHGSDTQSVVTHADEALYVSKQQGRNRVTVFNPQWPSKLATPPKKKLA